MRNLSKQRIAGPFVLDEERLVLLLRGEPLALGPKVVLTLLALLEAPGEVLSKGELLDRIWPEEDVEESNLAQNIYVIRKTFAQYWKAGSIETVPRRGYRFVQAAARPRRNALAASLVASLAAALILGFMHSAAGRPPQPATLSSSGSQLYAIGMYYWKQRTKAALRKSEYYFKALIATDPRNARGYAALAQAYAIDGIYEFGPRSVAASFAIARTYAQRALQLDPNCGEAHAALGLSYDRPATRKLAFAEYHKAVTLDPAYGPAHQWYGQALLQAGKSASAYREFRKAVELDPVSIASLAWLSSAAYLSRHYSEAEAYARRTIDLAPDREDAYFSLGLAYEGRHQYSAAVRVYREYQARCPSCTPDAAALLAHAYASAGKMRQAKTELAIAAPHFQMLEAEHGSRIWPDLVAALLAMGRRGDALAAVRAAVKSGGLYTSDPRLDPIRSDSRFRPYLAT